MSLLESNRAATNAQPCHGSGAPSTEPENCVLKAMDATVALAELRDMFNTRDAGIGLSYDHLKMMQKQMHERPMNDGKLNRWLGWAQCLVVAADCASLDDMREINARFITQGS